MKGRKKEILDELKKAAPTLLIYKDTHPFAVPKNYFRENPERLRTLASGVERIRKETSHQTLKLPEKYFEHLPDKIYNRVEKIKSDAVPLGYFDELPGRIMGIIKEEKVNPKGSPSGIRWLNAPRATAIAAILAGAIAVLTLLLTHPQEQKAPLAKIDQISTEELESYVEWNIKGIEEDNLKQLLDEDQQLSITEEEIGTEQLENYLKDDIDLTTLEDML